MNVVILLALVATCHATIFYALARCDPETGKIEGAGPVYAADCDVCTNQRAADMIARFPCDRPKTVQLFLSTSDPCKESALVNETTFDKPLCVKNLRSGEAAKLIVVDVDPTHTHAAVSAANSDDPIAFAMMTAMIMTAVYYLYMYC